MQETCIRNRVGEAEVHKGGESIKFMGKVIAPVNRHMTSAQSLRSAAGWNRAVQARVEIKCRPFRGISQAHVRVSHATRKGCTRLRCRRRDEEIGYTHVHRKVFAENVANCRIYVSNESIRVATSFIGFGPRKPVLLGTAFRGFLHPSSLPRQVCDKQQ